MHVCMTVYVCTAMTSTVDPEGRYGNETETFQNMATSVPSSSLGPSCPVCYRDYSDSDSVLVPRILHCGHTYCTECLQRLLAADSEQRNELDSLVSVLFGRRGGGLLNRMYPRDSPSPSHEVTCPVCKSSNHIQDGDVGNLTKNFALLGFRDGDTKQASRHYCKEHEHEQRVYCQDCQLLICAYCQLYGQHKNHLCAIASEACQPAVEEVRAIQAVVHGELEQLQAGEAAVLSRVKKLERGQSTCERDLTRYFDRLIDTLQQKRDSEVQRVRSWANEQAFVLHSQLHSLTDARKNCGRLLEECKMMTEHDPLRSLTEKDSLKRRADALSRNVAGLSLEPIITPRISSHQVLSRAETMEVLRELVEGVQVSMSLESGDEGGSEEEKDEEGEKDSDSLATSDSSVGGGEVRVQSLHAQDTHHNAEPTRLDFANGLPKLDPAAFPLEPHPASATSPSQVSTPVSYATHTHGRSNMSQLHFPSSQHSPASTNSDNDSGEEYKVLTFRQPLPFLMSSGARRGYSAGVTASCHGYHMSHDEANHADDEEEEEEEQRDTSITTPSAPCPSPPLSLPVPSITSSSAQYSWPGEQDSRQTVSLSVGGQEVHISIAGSAWPIPMNSYPRLMDEAPPLLAGDAFLDMEGDDHLVEDSD